MLESGVMGVDLSATQITHIIYSHLNAAAVTAGERDHR